MNRRYLLGVVFCATVLTGLVPLAAMAEEQRQDRLTLWQDGDPGEKLNLRGRVVALDGAPIVGALVQVRQANGNAEYTASYQGSLISGERGSFSLLTAVPGQYTSAKHIHIRVTHPDFQQLATEILFKGDPNISFGDADALEVLLEQIHNDGEVANVGGVEIMLKPK